MRSKEYNSSGALAQHAQGPPLCLHTVPSKAYSIQNGVEDSAANDLLWAAIFSPL